MSGLGPQGAVEPLEKKTNNEKPTSYGTQNKGILIPIVDFAPLPSVLLATVTPVLIESILRYGALTCCVYIALRSVYQDYSRLVNLGCTCNIWFMKLFGHFDVSTYSVLSTGTNVTYAEQLYGGLLREHSVTQLNVIRCSFRVP
jgi:hypothetical protein